MSILRREGEYGVSLSFVSLLFFTERKMVESKEMGIESKLTSKCQTTIPAEVREFLKIGAGDRIGYEFVDGKVVLVPKNRSALDLAGILYDPKRKPVSIEEMNEAIGDAMTQEYERSIDRR